jgi:uncharacterized protein (DUF4415 family)
MKIEKTANSQKITMSKDEWSLIGKQAGWMPKNVDPINSGQATLVESVRLENKVPDPQNQLHYSEIILYQDGGKWYVQPSWGVVGGNNPGGSAPVNFNSESDARNYFNQMKNAQMAKGFEISNNENLLAKKLAYSSNKIEKEARWTKTSQTQTRTHYEIRINSSLVESFDDLSKANEKYENILNDDWKEPGEHWQLIEVTNKVLRSEEARRLS